MGRTPPAPAVSINRLLGLMLLSIVVGGVCDLLGPPISTVGAVFGLLVFVVMARDLFRMLDLKSWWVPGWTLVAVVLGAVGMMEGTHPAVAAFAQLLSAVAIAVVGHTLASTAYMRS
jgi:hypothetical protein